MDASLQARVHAAARGDGPLEAVAAAARVAEDLAETADVVVVPFLDQARRAGYSWTEILAQLRSSRNRRGDAPSTGPQLPTPPVTVPLPTMTGSTVGTCGNLP